MARPSEPAVHTMDAESAPPSAQQARSLRTRQRIINATISVLATDGLASVTYRSVAEKAGVALAATTYHFDSKLQIIAAASETILEQYRVSFERTIAQRIRSKRTEGLPEFVQKMLRTAATTDRETLIAWAEITLSAARNRDQLELSRAWNIEIGKLWSGIAAANGEENPTETAQSAINIVFGLFYLAAALKLTEDKIDAVLVHGCCPIEFWISSDSHISPPAPEFKSRKSQDTRAQIIDAAIDLLITEGPTAIGYRSIAERAGLTTAAPTYYFPTIDSLLLAAQSALFERYIDRYQASLAPTAGPNLSQEHLVDLSTTIFIRESTESSGENLAAFSIWLEAARRPDLRSMVWSTFSEQYSAWQRILKNLNTSREPRKLDGLLIFAWFAGRLIRTLSTGSTTDSLAWTRSEFDRNLRLILSDKFWI